MGYSTLGMYVWREGSCRYQKWAECPRNKLCPSNFTSSVLCFSDSIRKLMRLVGGGS